MDPQQPKFYINDLDKRTNFIVAKFADETKLTICEEGWTSLQWDRNTLDKLERS